MAGHIDLSLAGMAAPYQMQRQPTGCPAREAMVPLQGTNASGWRVLRAYDSLVERTAPSEVHEEHSGKVGCALFTCVELSQHKIAGGLIADHIDLSLAGMAAPRQVERQLACCSIGKAMIPSPRVESLLEDHTHSLETIMKGQREDNKRTSSEETTQDGVGREGQVPLQGTMAIEF